MMELNLDTLELIEFFFGTEFSMNSWEHHQFTLIMSRILCRDMFDLEAILNEWSI
jgi:hypothetical protein